MPWVCLTGTRLLCSMTFRGALMLKHGSCLFVFGWFVCACASEPGASSSGSGGGGTPTEAPLASEDCITQCAAKATSCGAPSEVAQSKCMGICSGQATQSQLTCLSGKSCEELARVDNPTDLNTVCPKATSSGSGSDAGASGGSCKKFGTECSEVGSTECCEDAVRTNVICYSIVKPMEPARKVCCAAHSSGCSTDSDCCDTELDQCSNGKCVFRNPK